MSRKKIILVGNGPNLNRGCEAILRGTLRILGEVFSDPLVENHFFLTGKTREQGVFAARPGISGGILEEPLPDVRPVPRFSPTWLLYQLGRRIGPHDLGYLGCGQAEDAFRARLASADAALQAGGDNYSLDYGFPLKHAVLDRALKSRGIPVILWGASVGPFGAGSRTEKWMIAHFHKNVDLILVREKASLDYLHRVGLGGKSLLTGDPAFVMAPVMPPKKLLEGINPEGAIGVNLSPILHRYGASGNDLQQWANEAGILIRSLHESFDRPILLIPHVIQPGNDDHEFMQEAVLKAGIDPGNVAAVPRNLTAAELKWVISRLDRLIAARTHATIAGFSSHVPTISIGYSLKASGLNQQVFGHRDFLVPVRELSPARLVDVSRRALEQADDIRSHLAGIIPRIQASAFSGGEILKEYLEGRV